LKKSTVKKILIYGGIGLLILNGFSLSKTLSGIKGIMEFGIFVLFALLIYYMFFSKKKVEEYDPSKGKQPPYDKNNYQTPPKEANSYTPPPPTGDPQPFAEVTADGSNVSLPKQDRDKSLLGYELKSQREFFIADDELNGMCLLLGATGAGKTTAIKTLLERPIMFQDPIIIVDGKGSPSFFEEVEAMCKKHNRNFKLFNMNDVETSKHYNSLRHGGFTELKDKIMSIFDFSDEYYQKQSDRYLQGVFRFLLMPEVKELLNVRVIDFKVLSDCMSMETMQTLAENIGEKAGFMLTILNEIDEKAVNGFISRLQSVLESELSDLFIDTQDPNVIDLLQSIQANDVVFFSLDSLKFPEYARMLGRLIIADMKTVSPRFYNSGKRIYTVFDEFNVFASDIIVNLINKTREYGFRNIIATQELADMIVNGDSKLLNQIMGNTNVKIVLRQDVPGSCEELANAVNTRDIYKPTISFGGDDEESTLLGQGGKKQFSATLEEELIYKPREFSQLGRGEAIVFTKFPQFRHAKIKVRRV